MIRAWIPVLLALASASTAAETVYRCGSTYSKTPCADGQSVVAADPRTVDQRQQAVAAALREAKLAQQLEKDRKARDAIAAGKGPAGFHTAPKAAPAPKAAKTGKPKPPSKKKPRTAPEKKSR